MSCFAAYDENKYGSSIIIINRGAYGVASVNFFIQLPF